MQIDTTPCPSPTITNQIYPAVRLTCTLDKNSTIIPVERHAGFRSKEGVPGSTVQLRLKARRGPSRAASLPITRHPVKGGGKKEELILASRLRGCHDTLQSGKTNRLVPFGQGGVANQIKAAVPEHTEKRDGETPVRHFFSCPAWVHEGAVYQQCIPVEAHPYLGWLRKHAETGPNLVINPAVLPSA
ncbi:hypothetical protein CIHG_09965 [Coccidioides immitis H538.4]|uniref:Uncharacterized protein n=1 Tax=Coccidioides immitis H538.4 TaxID=396776 RepID=A0A0J8S404_COCIT|nr:hypothetical protein CIHG_09965 [Coccidioides immitis H538.4]